jgi:hypothetical protein
MSLKKAIQHNQSLFISAIITCLCFGGMFACHLTQKQAKAILDTTVAVAEIAAPVTPTPWREILLAAASLLGSGAVVDNRRKDILIKRLKTENANQNNVITNIATTNNNNPSRAPPLHYN